VERTTNLGWEMPIVLADVPFADCGREVAYHGHTRRFPKPTPDGVRLDHRTTVNSYGTARLLY
jgi:hypothetical protein